MHCHTTVRDTSAFTRFTNFESAISWGRALFLPRGAAEWIVTLLAARCLPSACHRPARNNEEPRLQDAGPSGQMMAQRWAILAQRCAII